MLWCRICLDEFRLQQTAARFPRQARELLPHLGGAVAVCKEWVRSGTQAAFCDQGLQHVAQVVSHAMAG